MNMLVSFLIFTIGLFFVLAAIGDLLWTVFMEGGPPITTRVCHFVVRGLFAMQERHRSRRVVAAAGLIAVMSTVFTWAALAWIGWGLIFNASHRAIVDGNTLQPPDVITRFYFAGTTLFTLGLGDYKPVGHFWQFMTTIAAANGFLMVGLALAYLMAVVSAATQKRQLAVCISALGKSPDEIIIRAWNGADSTALGPHLVSLIPMLALLGESHLSYPILHYFHSTKRSASVASSVASLDEALTILECGLQRGCSLDLPSLGAAREAITEFLLTLKPALIKPEKEIPPVPSLKRLKDSGVPVVDGELFSQSLVLMTDRRRLLQTLVNNEGWEWNQVWPETVKVPLSTADISIAR